MYHILQFFLTQISIDHFFKHRNIVLFVMNEFCYYGGKLDTNVLLILDMKPDAEVHSTVKNFDSLG